MFRPTEMENIFGVISVVAIGLFVLINNQVDGEIIPYSYARGRDVAAVERRYQNFQNAKARGASTDELNEICGPVAQHQTQCALAGRPSDAATMFCDSMCCLAGSKVGNCGKVKLQIKPDWLALITSLTSNNTLSSLKNLNPKLAKECSCSDDPADVKCGPDGSFLGIRCPFDNSACWRKCCRQGKSDGKCRWFSCKCK